MTTTWTLNTDTALETLNCYLCGVIFAMPEPLKQRRREDSKSFWCPNGHEQHFTETEAARLRKQLERAQSAATAARDQADAAERSNRALRGVVTRERKRVGRGLCPCCNRTFQDLARHMAGQHPDFAESGPS